MYWSFFRNKSYYRVLLEDQRPFLLAFTVMQANSNCVEAVTLCYMLKLAEKGTRLMVAND